MSRTPVRYPLLLMGLLGLFWSAVGSAHQPSAADCAAEADRASRGQGTVMGGAVAGAVGGAAFGAIVGGSSKGAWRGAAVGSVVGAAHNAYRNNEVYQRVYDDCMRGYYHHH